MENDQMGSELRKEADEAVDPHLGMYPNSKRKYESPLAELNEKNIVDGLNRNLSLLDFISDQMYGKSPEVKKVFIEEMKKQFHIVEEHDRVSGTAKEGLTSQGTHQGMILTWIPGTTHPVIATGEQKAEFLNQFIKEENEKAKQNFYQHGIDTNLISDGYHTFGELYEHRITNFIALARVVCHAPKYHSTFPVWISRKHSDGELAFGGTWFVLGIGKEAGVQMTYHLPLSKWANCWFAEVLEQAPTFDGHTSANVLERLEKYL